jgi:photosystem II stability/assembly factor-like uncharacterized protein
MVWFGRRQRVNGLPRNSRSHRRSLWDRRLVPVVRQLEDRTLPSTSIPLNATGWTNLGPNPISPGTNAFAGRVTAIAADPSDANTIYLASAGGGVWVTHNAQAATITWTPLTDNINVANPGPTDDQLALFMGSIALGPKNPVTGKYNIIYAGEGEANSAGDTYYGHGLLKSIDSGATWTLQGNGFFDRTAITAITPDPNNPNVVYLSTSTLANDTVNGRSGVWKSLDGGLTWTNTTAAAIQGSSSRDFDSLIMDPTNSQILYTGINRDSIYKTTDGGTTWTRLTAGIPLASPIGRIALAISQTNSPQTIYASIANRNSSGLDVLIKSTDQGLTWSTMSTTPNYLGTQGYYDNVIAVLPTDGSTVYAGGQNDFEVTSDAGNSWKTLFPGPHSDFHAIAFDANGTLLTGTDGGIWKLTNPNPTSFQWADLNGNLGTAQFYSAVLNPTDANIAYGGTQDNGTVQFKDLGISAANAQGWSQIRTGDGGYMAIAGGHPLVVFHEFINSQSPFLEVSTDGGVTWNSATSGINTSDPSQAFIPYVIDPANDNRLLLGTDHIYETLNALSGGALTWTAIGTPGTGGWPAQNTAGGAYTVHYVAAVPANNQFVYAVIFSPVFGAAPGGYSLWRTTNHGASWTQIASPGGNGAAYGKIVTDPANPNIVYVTAASFPSDPGLNGSTVWQSTDGGQTWRSLNGLGLPNVPVDTMLLDPWTKILYVGTDNGVYASDTYNNAAGPITWVRVGGTALPDAQVDDLTLSTVQKQQTGQQTGEGYILAVATHGRGVWEINTIHFQVQITDTSGNPLSRVIAGIPFNLTITALDSFNQKVAGYTGVYTGSVNFATSDAAATLPASYTFTTQDSDAHTFTNVVLKTVGTQTITVTDPLNGGVPKFTLSLPVDPAVEHFAVTIPASVQAGTSFSVTLSAVNAAGVVDTTYRGTVALTSSDATGTLPTGSYTFTATDAGVHVFSGFLFNKASAPNTPTTITFTDSKTPLAITQQIQVLPGPVTRFQVSAPATNPAGSAFNITVSALDSLGNVNYNYTGTVVVTTSDTSGILPTANPYTFTATDAGAHTFTGFQFTKAGPSGAPTTITFTDSKTPLTASVSVVITPLAATHFGLILPANSQAGSPFSVTVTALDKFNNIASGYAGKISFSSSDSSATLPAPYTFTVSSPLLPPDPTKDNGQHTFTNAFTFTKTGTPTLTITDNSSPPLTLTQSIAITPPPVSQFVATLPVSIPAGTPFSLTVTAADKFGNANPTYTGTVTLTSSDPTASLPGPYAFTAADGGVHTFTGLVFAKAGTPTITISDNNTPPLAATTSITVTPLPASRLVIGLPAINLAGSSFSATVTALDSLGNVATGYTGAVTFTSSDSTATLPTPNPYTFTTADEGQHVFTNAIKFTKAGTPTLTVTDNGTPPLTTTTSIQVAPLAATHFQAVVPASSPAGSPFTVILMALDPFGNVDSNYRGTVTSTSSDTSAGATLPDPYTFTAADAGLHRFTGGFAFQKAGTPTITFADNSSPSVTTTTPVITITPLAATHLQITLPGTVTAGAAFTMTVTALDPFSNIDYNYAGKIAFTSTDPNATLPAPYTFTTSSPPLPPNPAKDNGQHTFPNVTLNAGPQTLTVSDTQVTGNASLVVNNGVPTLTAISPGSGVESNGVAPLTLTLTGTNFLSASVVQVNGTAIPSTFVNPTQLTATLPGFFLTNLGNLTISVVNPAPGGGTANLLFPVNDAPLLPTPAGNITASPNVTTNTVPLATFTDAASPGPLSNYSSTVDWGDGTTSAGSISLSGTTFSVTGSHTYTGPGLFQVVVHIADSGGSKVDTPLKAVVGSDTQRYLNQLYLSLFNRPIDNTGLNFLTPELQNGLSRTALVQQLTHSAEYYKIFVNQLYQQFLSRPADPTGLQSLTNQLQSGLTDAQAEAALLGSQEFFNKNGGTNQKWVDAVYVQLFSRPADPGGEGFWVQQIKNGGSLTNVALALATSAEGSGHTIENDFQRYLGRPASPSDVSALTTAFAQGLSNEDLIAALLGSDEYFRKSTAT